MTEPTPPELDSRRGLGRQPPRDAHPGPPPVDASGVYGLVDAVERYAAEASGDSHAVIRRLGEDFAYIRWQDLTHPLRFLRQMAGNPPLQLGVDGFRKDMVDDKNPARHYIAFVVMGYWLPRPLADLVLWLWEIAGFLRYGFSWSPPDIACGYLGIRHGRRVRRQGIGVLAELIRRELAEPGCFSDASSSNSPS